MAIKENIKKKLKWEKGARTFAGRQGQARANEAEVKSEVQPALEPEIELDLDMTAELEKALADIDIDEEQVSAQASEPAPEPASETEDAPEPASETEDALEPDVKIISESAESLENELSVSKNGNDNKQKLTKGSGALRDASSAASSKVGNIANGLGDVAKKTRNGISNVAGKAGTAVGGVASKTGNAIGGVAGKAGTAVGSALGKTGNAVRGISGAVSGAAGAVSVATAGVVGGIKGAVAGASAGAKTGKVEAKEKKREKQNVRKNQKHNANTNINSKSKTNTKDIDDISGENLANLDLSATFGIDIPNLDEQMSIDAQTPNDAEIKIDLSNADGEEKNADAGASNTSSDADSEKNSATNSETNSADDLTSSEGNESESSADAEKKAKSPRSRNRRSARSHSAEGVSAEDSANSNSDVSGDEASAEGKNSADSKDENTAIGDNAEDSQQDGAKDADDDTSNNAQDDIEEDTKGKKGKKGKKDQKGKKAKKPKKKKESKPILTPEEKQAIKEEKEKKKKEKKALKKEKAKEKKQLKKQTQKEKKAAKKVKRKEKKAIRKEKKREKKRIKKEKRKAWMAARSKTTKICLFLVLLIFLECAGSAGYMFLPPFIESIPGRIEDFKNRPDPQDEEVIEAVEETIDVKIEERDYFEEFSLAGATGSKVQNALYVSPSGNDTNTGSELAPLKSIQRGIDLLGEGGVLYLKEGTYSENIIISKQGARKNYVTITSAKGEKAILDGKDATNSVPLIKIQGSEFVTISNLELQNADSAIEITNSKNIIIAGNKIHGISGIADKGCAISVLNANPTSVKSILIYYNKIHDCGNGQGAAISVAGNTEYINLMGNIIQKIRGDGIRYSGNHGVCVEESLDNPRRCTISGNTVKLCTNGEENASGIYIDGGRGISLEDNVVFRCDKGIGIAGEVPNELQYTYNIVIKNNLIACNKSSAVQIGSDIGSGAFVRDVKLYNNSMINSYKKEAQADLTILEAFNIDVKNNIFYNDKTSGSPIAIRCDKDDNRNIKFNNNLYKTKASENDVTFVGFGETITGLESWQEAMKDSDSMYHGGNLLNLCQDASLGDYSYFQNSKVIGCTILHAAE